jgi:hypothetical protein
MRFKHLGSCNFVNLGCTICREVDSFHGEQWDLGILGIVILQALAAQFAEKWEADSSHREQWEGLWCSH